MIAASPTINRIAYPLSFAEKLEFGKLGEGRVAKWLKKQGYNVLPVYEKEIHEGKGPVLFTSNISELIAPDMVAFQKTKNLESPWILWAEAKTKSAFSWSRKYRAWCTGIDLRHYEDYLKVQELSPFPVYIFFLHLDGMAKDTPQGMKSPTGLFGRNLKYLCEHENHRCPPEQWGKGGMVYWTDKDLRKFCELSEMPL